MLPSCAPADAIDEELPGSVRIDAEPLVLDDRPWLPNEAGGEQGLSAWQLWLAAPH